MMILDLFIGFLIPGVIGYGGGPGSITIIQEQVVEKYAWLTTEQFNELLSICNALPGPIATKLGFSVGYLQAGVLGAIVSTLAISLPSILLIVLLMSILIKNKENPRVKRLSKFIMPVIVVLFIELTMKFMIQSFQNLPGIIHSLIILSVSFVFIFLIKKVHPLVLILGAMAYGFVIL